MLKKKKENNTKISLKEKITKKNILYLLISLVDIIFIIYCARHNYANYATIPNEESFFVGDSKDLLFGKNYIVLIFTIFIYIYVILANKLFFKIKYSKKNILKKFLIIFLINTIIFFIFTKRIY